MFFTKREKLLLVLIVLLIIVLSGTVYLNRAKPSDFIAGEEEEDYEEIQSTNPIEEPRQIGVHISGYVKTPGFIWVEEGTRLYDAIGFVGGAHPEADLDLVNLSKVLTDEEKIYIPRKGENVDLLQANFVLNATVNDNKADSKININVATESELCTLPGIGPALAQRIIEHRNAQGLFESVEDIKTVNGIGEKRFNDIKDMIKVK